MQRRARSRATLVGALIILAATFSATAHAEGWHDPAHGYALHGYSGGGSAFGIHPGDGGPYDGARLWAGIYFDSIQFSTGSNTHPWTDVYGSGNGDDHGVSGCATGNNSGGFVVGIWGHAGYYVDALGIICDDGTHHELYRAEAGGSGGEYFSDKCAPGEVVLEFKGRAGSWMDNFQIYCGRP